MKLVYTILLIVLVLAIIVSVLYKTREGYYNYTYVNSPDVKGIFPTYSGAWGGTYYGNFGLPSGYGFGLPFVRFNYNRGYAPYIYPYRSYYPYRSRYPYRPNRPFVGTVEYGTIGSYPVEHLEYFEKENFVGADDERNNSCIGFDGKRNFSQNCVNNKFQYLSGYPRHGFTKVCDLKFPRDIAGKMPSKLDIPMITATKNAKNYEIGRWVHYGKGYSKNGNIDVYQFNIDPSRNLYNYKVVDNSCGKEYSIDFQPGVHGMEDGYKFYVPDLDTVFLLRKDKEFLYAWR